MTYAVHANTLVRALIEASMRLKTITRQTSPSNPMKGLSGVEVPGTVPHMKDREWLLDDFSFSPCKKNSSVQINAKIHKKAIKDSVQ